MRQRGFTIVELLIVIVIIAILAAIVTIAYNGVQNRAADAAVQADLRNMGHKAAAFVAASKSGKIYVFTSHSGAVREAGPWAGNGNYASCTSANTTGDTSFSFASGGRNEILLQSTWATWI